VIIVLDSETSAVSRDDLLSAVTRLCDTTVVREGDYVFFAENLPTAGTRRVSAWGGVGVVEHKKQVVARVAVLKKIIGRSPREGE